MDHTNYVLYKGLKIYFTICSFGLRGGFLIRCALLVFEIYIQVYIESLK